MWALDSSGQLSTTEYSTKAEQSSTAPNQAEQSRGGRRRAPRSRGETQVEGRGQQGRGRPSLRNFNPSPFLRLGLPSPFHHDVLLITFCHTLSFHDLNCTFSQISRSAPRLPGRSCGRMDFVLNFIDMEMTRLKLHAHCQLCILHVLVSLKTTSSLNLQCQSCGRSFSQLLVSRQVCLLPICRLSLGW